MRTPHTQNARETDFKTFLQAIRAKATSKRGLGDLFEKAIRDFLKASPEHDFEDVWMWSEWPDLRKYKFTKQDLGIDLVAKENQTGKFWAIQCKCYGEDVQVTKKDIDSFFNHSGKKPFETRLIVTTTNNWHPHAMQSIENQSTPCHLLNLTNLENTSFDWSITGKVKRRPNRKILKDHQREALKKAFKHFQNHDRGKLIMACGTGKTLTSLAIVEKITSDNARVLFLAPSIALVNQTLKEYAYQHKSPQSYLVVCSDTKVGREETGQTIADLQRSPTTNPYEIAKHLKQRKNRRLVVFCTYQSLKQIKESQSQYNAPAFDLVICDEAHRTTGIEGNEMVNGKTKGNYFTSINKSDYVKAKKRLYMTATPKIYSPKVKSKASEDNIEIHCMDDTDVYGGEFYRLDFSRAIEQKLLSDYQVIILDIKERFISDQMGRFQTILKNTNLSLKDASLLIGCYKALRDQGENEKGRELKRAVGFLNTIRSSQDSKEAFKDVVEALKDHQYDGFTCDVEHIDGNDHSIIKSKKISWLKEDVSKTDKDETVCRILMNAKCLTEGIDVPSLDAVMFLHPRKSQVDVVQAVGRAIRKLQGKEYGYIILPVVIPSGKTPEQALDDNKTYQVVWQVLNALRAHDSSFNAVINNLDLNENKTPKIKIIDVGGKDGKDKDTTESTDKPTGKLPKSIQQYTIDQIEHKIYAKIVEKCGDRAYKETWIKGIKDTVQTLQTRINSLITGSPQIKSEFKKYLSGLHNSINPEITKETATSMLAEHIVTKEVFDKLFEGYKFSDHNPVSKTIQEFLKSLDKFGFSNELKQLEGFYDSVGSRISKIDNSKGRQRAIKDLYGDFIKTAFPKMAERLGVAYTPVEIVDFILQSADELLKQEFRRGLTDENVHIIDPFVGTGTFINRLIQNEYVELIKDKDLKRKFEKELHANEIMLLPYYIASINIEEAYHSRSPNEDYQSFPGITLTDTFNLDEQKEVERNGEVVHLFGNDQEQKPFYENRKRIGRQRKSPIRVIVSNPPYSGGQKSENDGNKNTEHFFLDERIRKTYKSNAQKKKNDTYIKAIRWATDRLGDNEGVIGFIHNSSLLHGNSTDGLRKCLVKEFDAIYCFNLKGDQRTKGEMSKKEGGKVFGGSSRTPISITFLIKRPIAKRQNSNARVYYYDIGDYCSREKKLEIVKNFQSINGIQWKEIIPDQNGDWLNQRDKSFDNYLPIGERQNQKAIFDLYSLGVATSRDYWAYNFNKKALQKNMKKMIDFYNQELERLNDKEINLQNIDRVINRDNDKISWSRKLKREFLRKKKLIFKNTKIKLSSYKPFMKKRIYFDKVLNEEQYHLPKIFSKEDQDNRLICVSGLGAKTFSTLMTDAIPDLNFITPLQCFPFYYFDQNGHRQESITDQALNKFQNHYKDQKISKWDVFYYTYGLLHSEDYRKRFKNNLSKQLPRIPFATEFYQFSKIGKELAEIHLNYENQLFPSSVQLLKDGHPTKVEFLKKDDLNVTKMRIDKNDKSKIKFNDKITIINIPQEAWDYKINDWSAIKWITERYQYKTDRKSGLINDPNSYSDDPAYILKLLLSIITVSLKTQKLINQLPSIDFEQLTKARAS